MQITRDQPVTGTAGRTRREEIPQLFTGAEQLEPEFYGDCSQSEGFEWTTNPNINTWSIQVPAMKVVTGPFSMLDGKGDGVFTYWFNHQYLPMEGDGEEDDMNPDNFDEKMAAFMRRYRQFFRDGVPAAGGTEIMSAVEAADKRFLKEFPDPNERFYRMRIAFSDGQLNDAAKFRKYLAQTTPHKDDPQLGVHTAPDGTVWMEKWAVALLGDKDSGTREAYDQYVAIAKDHPWVHPVSFEGVTNPDEIGEDMAFMTIPAKAA